MNTFSTKSEMKELTLVRHAKSDWEKGVLQDIDRCLSERGYSDAYTQATRFAGQYPAPDLILTSTATRALSTALIFSRTLHCPASKVVLEPQIYEADTEHLLQVITRQKNNINRLMLFGHNPGLTDLCNALADNIDIDNLPTCGLLMLQFNTSNWKDIKLKSGKVIDRMFPKDIKHQE